MNARLTAKLLRMPQKAERIPRQPAKLTPIAWGKRDRELARGVMRNIADTTPAIRVPFIPGLRPKLRDFLSHYGVRA